MLSVSVCVHGCHCYVNENIGARQFVFQGARYYNVTRKDEIISEHIRLNLEVVGVPTEKKM
jgi:hypothetical protein